MLVVAPTSLAYCSSRRNETGDRHTSDRERWPEGSIIPDREFKEDVMPDQRKQQNQHGGKAGQQQRGGGQERGQQRQPNQKSNQAGRKQQEVDKK
jgi:hypothetical protein